MSSYQYYRRAAPPLPPPASLPFPGNLVRECSDCSLRAGCNAPVPGIGPAPARIMLIGEAPGANEDEWGKPFVGQAGRQLDSLLFQVGVPREGVYITNLIRCRPPGNRDPKPSEIKACTKWLNIEVGLVNPDIVVAMGAPAIAWVLGPGCGTVEHLHGKPIEMEVGSHACIVLPTYHPAAVLYNTTLLRQLYDDFQVLRGLAKGGAPSDYLVQDEHPDPTYQVADTAERLDRMFYDIRQAEECAVDVETIERDTQLWSIQVSAQPGTAWFVPVGAGHQGRVDTVSWDSRIIVHYYLNDINWLQVPDHNFVDTMTAAYLCGLPQGLKELASRICGIDMVSYSEVVRPGQRKQSLEYLTEAAKRDWPDPPGIEETKWSNKEGRVITRIKKPKRISSKIARILADTMDNIDVDPYRRWHDIPGPERLATEKKLGPMPESSLASIKFEDAVRYACRDADATLRVKRKMEGFISELGLDFVLYMDLSMLPMVDEMMRTGMPVDLDHLRSLSTEYDARMRAKAAELASVVGHPFNPNSSSQVATVVYGELGFKPTRLTPTKEISTDDQELKKTGHPVAKGVIEYRRLSKIKGTYADALAELAVLDSNGTPRVHTTLKTTRVATGRLSSTDPNLQNIPVRSKDGKAIRVAFIAAFGKLLGEGDLAQIEMCTQAHLAVCKGLIDIFLRGGDPHAETAALLFGVSLETAKLEKYRYPTKRANFGVLYLIGARGLSNQIQEYIADLEMEGEKVDVEPWDERTCEKYIEDWYKLYPEVRDYQQEMAAMARRYGYVKDLFGRIRYIPEVNCPIRATQEAGLRMAANMPVTACLPADTRVTTRAGWLPIGEFTDGTEVWTGERWARATKYYMGDNRRVRLHLSDGRTFDCDDKHKLLVQVGLWPEWKSVLDIGQDEPLGLDWSTAWGRPLGDPGDWYWAGRFVGDGWLSSPRAKLPCWSVAFGHEESADGQRMTCWLDTKRIGGRNNADPRGYHFDYDRNGNFRIRGGTRDGYNLWLSLGLEPKKAREKRIPPVVFTLDCLRRRAFLDGYTSADGTTDRRRWQITSASRQLLEDTVRLAQSVGLSAWVGDGKTRVYWNNRPSTLWPCYILKSRRSVTVVRREILAPEPMYTLSVHDERHAFATEGLISKNSAQGIIKLAMGELWRGLPKTGWREHVRFLMQIHDSLIVEITDDDDILRPYLAWMRDIMCGAVKLLVPVKVDFKVGKRWGELEKY